MSVADTSTFRRGLLLRVVNLIDEGGLDSENLTFARNLIAEAGVLAEVHVGTDPADFTDDMVCEWMLGQFADLIDSKAWFAMNSGINVARNHLEHPHGWNTDGR